MASRYIIVCNYGTHDGNMVQINNMLTYDKNFYDCEKLCQRLNKSMYFEKQHCRWSSQYLSKILAANFLIFFLAFSAVTMNFLSILWMIYETNWNFCTLTTFIRPTPPLTAILSYFKCQQAIIERCLILHTGGHLPYVFALIKVICHWKRQGGTKRHSL